MFKRVVNIVLALMVLFTSGAALADTFRIRVLQNGAPVVGVSFVGNQGFNNSGPYITGANGEVEITVSPTQIAKGLELVPFRNSGEALSFHPARRRVDNVTCRNGQCPSFEAIPGPRTQVIHLSTVSTNGRPVAGIDISMFGSLEDRTTFTTDSDGYVAVPVAARTTCSDTDSDPSNNFVNFLPASPARHTYSFRNPQNYRICPTRNSFSTITVTGGEHSSIPVGASVTYNLQFSTLDDQPIEGVTAHGPNLSKLPESARTSNAYGLLRLNTAELGVDKNYTFELYFSSNSHRIAQQGMKLSPNSCRNHECKVLGVRKSDSSSNSVVMVWQALEEHGPEGLSGVRVQDVATQASVTTDSLGFAYFPGRFDPSCTAPQVISPSMDGYTFSSNSGFSLCATSRNPVAQFYSNRTGQMPSTVPVAGRVFDKLGQPYVNRAVFANGVFAAITNSQGAYSFQATRHADLSVSVNPEPGTFYDPVHVGFTKLASEVGGLVFNQVLPLPGEDPGIGDGCEVSDRYIVSGRVFDYEGRPVAGVIIHDGEGDNIVAQTGADGRYSVSVGALNNVLVRPEFGEQLFWPAAISIPRIICNSEDNDLHFTQIESVAVRGQVTYGGSQPAAGLTVVLVSEDEFSSKQTYQTTTTQFDGTFDVYALEGSKVQLRVSTEIQGAIINPDFREFYADGENAFDDNDFVISLPPTPTPSPTPTPVPTSPPAPGPTAPPAQPVPTPTTPPSFVTPVPSATNAPATPLPSATVAPTNPSSPVPPSPSLSPSPTATLTPPPPSATVAPAPTSTVPVVIPAPSPTPSLAPPTPSPAPTALPTSSPDAPITVVSGCENKVAGTLSWVATNPNSGAVILEYRIKDSNPEIRSIVVLSPGQTTFNTAASASVPFTYRMEYRVPGNSGGWSDAYHTRTICPATPSPTPSVTPALPTPVPSSMPTAAPSSTPVPAPSMEPTQSPTPEPTPSIDFALSAGCTAYEGHLKWVVTNYTNEGRVVLLRIYGQESASAYWAAQGETEIYTQVISGSANTMVAYTDKGVQFGVATPNFNRCGSDLTPTPSPTPGPTASAAPTTAPTAAPTPVTTPIGVPPTDPTAAPTPPSDRDPQPVPSARPTSEPTVAPTALPTAMPTVTPVNPERDITGSILCSASPGLAEIQIANGNSYGVTLRYLGLESGVSGGSWLQGGTQITFTLPLSQGMNTTVALYINENPVAAFYLQLSNASCSGAEPTPSPTASPTPTPEEPEYVAAGSILNQQGKRVTGRVATRLTNLINLGRLRVVIEDLSGDEVVSAVPFFAENRLVWTAKVKAGVYNIKLVGVSVVSKPRVFSRVVFSEKTVKQVAIAGSRPLGQASDNSLGRNGFNYAVK